MLNFREPCYQFTVYAADNLDTGPDDFVVAEAVCGFGGMTAFEIAVQYCKDRKDDFPGRRLVVIKEHASPWFVWDSQP